MLLAALGDIHGNLPAFEAVLGAIDREGVEKIIHTGDLVAGFPYSNTVIDRIIQREIAGVQGEIDRFALRFARKRRSLQERLPPPLWNELNSAVQRCSSGQIEFLRRLPRTLTLQLDGIGVAIAHGTLSSQTHNVDIEDDAHSRRQREIIPADIYVFGRTHIPVARIVDNALFVNPGSVGYGAAGPGSASYAIISTEHEPWQADLRTVTYK